MNLKPKLLFGVKVIDLIISLNVLLGQDYNYKPCGILVESLAYAIEWLGP